MSIFQGLFHVVKHLFDALSLWAPSMQLWNGPPAPPSHSSYRQPQRGAPLPPSGVAAALALLKASQRSGQRLLHVRPPDVHLYLILALLHSVNERFCSFHVFRSDGFLPPTWTKKACSKEPPAASLSPFKSGTVDLLFSENVIKISRKTTTQKNNFFFFWFPLFHQPFLSSVTHQVPFCCSRLFFVFFFFGG